MLGHRPTTDLFNSAEFGCSEENKSCSRGYPELIYSIQRQCSVETKAPPYLLNVFECAHHLVKCSHGPKPTTDHLHVLACAHCRCFVTCISGLKGHH